MGSKSARKRLFEEQNGKCHYCERQTTLLSAKDAKKKGGKALKRIMTYDHIIPLFRNGISSPKNRVGACFSCNTNRGHMPYELFKLYRKLPNWHLHVTRWHASNSRRNGEQHRNRNCVRKYRTFVYI